MDRAKTCNCTEPKCVKEMQELKSELDSESEDCDEDYILFHCKFCHNVAHGNTNFHCDECGHWVCQNCSETGPIKFADLNGVLCPECYKKPKFLNIKKQVKTARLKRKAKA